LRNAVKIESMRIVVIDDEPSNVALLERILEWSNYRNVESFTDPELALAHVRQRPPDLVLLDLQMPKMSGFTLLEQLRSADFEDNLIPILVFTADINPETRIQALSLGATDFLTKPGEAAEIMLRVRNVLEIRYLHHELRRHNLELEVLVKERTSQLVTSRLDALERLALAAEYRDDDTGEHTRRVGRVSSEIARLLKSPEATPEVLALAAPLHDIGKVGIPDAILLKPGKLTTEEFEVMKSHTTIGARILGGSDVDIFAVAASIALNHHEKWNGSGYPNGIKGEDIPLTARIVCVADVYDALTHGRCYKEAWPLEKAAMFIRERSGHEFDPEVVHVFNLLTRTATLSRAA
jgi:putative two-component system response regulator